MDGWRRGLSRRDEEDYLARRVAEQVDRTREPDVGQMPVDSPEGATTDSDDSGTLGV